MFYVVSVDEHYSIGTFPTQESAQRVVDSCPLPQKIAHLAVMTRDEYRAVLYQAYVKACKDAMTVQDACNLSGVVKSFFDVICTVKRWLEFEGDGTHSYRNHAAVVLFLDKIDDLCGRPSMREGYYHAAYNFCKTTWAKWEAEEGESLAKEVKEANRGSDE